MENPTPFASENPSSSELKPTITSKKRTLDAEESALTLKKGMDGEIDRRRLVDELTNMTNNERQVVATQYKKMYGKPLMEDLKSSLGGKLEKGVEALMYTPSEYDARSLHDALHGASKDQALISEILATRKLENLVTVKLAYERIFDVSLEDDIKNKISGHLERIYRSLLSGERDQDKATDREKAARDAQMLFDAGEEKRWGSDKSEFNRVFMTSNDEQMILVEEEYLKCSDHSLERAVEMELSGNLRYAYLALLQRIHNRPKFFAQRLHDALKGVTTDNETAIRIAVTRSEIDLGNIEEEYIKEFGEKPSLTVKEKAHGSEFKMFMGSILKEHTMAA